MPEVRLTPFDPAVDATAIATFLASNRFPFHLQPTVSTTAATARVDAGRYWSASTAGYWVLADGVRVGIVVLDDLDDISAGGSPLLDLRLDEQHRGQGLGVPAVQALAATVFGTWPALRRFEGHTREDNLAMRAVFARAGWVQEAHHREAWPVEGGEPVASIAYGLLRRDWENGTITPVPWPGHEA